MQSQKGKLVFVESRLNSAPRWSGVSRVGIVGREGERALLADAVAAASERGSAVVVSGQPGMGKSCLLADAVEHTHAGSHVAWVRGLASETVLPFAVAADLLAPLMDRELGRLPKSQQEALLQAFALEGSDQPISAYSAYVAALHLVSSCAERAPVILVLDDLQWIDDASQRMLAFVARRIGSDSVCILAAARELPAPWHDIDELHYLDLRGLDESGCRALLEAEGELVSGRVMAPLTELTAGNPLVLLETVRQLTPDQRSGLRPLPERPALGERLERAWEERLAALNARTQQALLLLAAHHSTAEATVEGALRAADLVPNDLDAAVRAGLVLHGRHDLDFFHPLFRSFVLARASERARREAYAVLAGAAPAESRVWYLAASTSGPDESLAVQLEGTAASARQRHGYAAASKAMQRAADLSPAPGQRTGRLLAAAADALLAGQLERVHQCCELGLAGCADPALRGSLLSLQGHSLMWVGDVVGARHTMLAAASELAGVDPCQEVNSLAEATLPAVMAARIEDAVALVDTCLAHPAATSLTADTQILLVQAMLTGGRVQAAREHLSAAREQLRSADPVGSQSALCIAGQCLTWTESFDESRGLLTHVIDADRRAQAPSLMPYALAALSEVDRWQGRWPAAYANATEAVQFAAELGQQGTAAYGTVCLARLDAMRGDADRVRGRARDVLEVVETLGVRSLETYTEAALGLGALGARELEVSVAHLRRAHRVGQRSGLTPTIVPYVGDLVEALVHAGHRDEAAEVADWLAGYPAETGLRWPAAVLSASLGLLADDPDQAAAALTEASTALEDLDVPFEHARVRLWLGERLRRDRRPAAARQPLRQALECFEVLGARPWASRAATELAAAGSRQQRTPRAAAIQLLTPQEFQVAQLVAEGMNNVEAAAALFMSRKTVEAHLTRIYRKLSIRSRTDLARLVADAR